MKPPSSPAARRAVTLVSGSGPRTHVRTGLCWSSTPYAALELEVPLEGDVLEVGCGQGLLSLYLAVCSRARRVTGVDPDPRRVDRARAAADRLLPREAHVGFEVTAPGEVPRVDGGWRSIVLADAVGHLDAERRRALLEACAEALAPGGLLVVKDVDTRPPWKARVSRLEGSITGCGRRGPELVGVEAPSRDELERVVAEAGLRAQAKRLDHGYLHPHCVVLGTRTTGT